MCYNMAFNLSKAEAEVTHCHYENCVRLLMSHGSEVDTEKYLAVGIQVVTGTRYSACHCRELKKKKSTP